MLPRQVLTLIPSHVGVYFLTNTSPLLVARLESNIIPENLTRSRNLPKVVPKEGTLALESVMSPPLPFLTVRLAALQSVLRCDREHVGSPVRLILKLILRLVPAIAIKNIPEETWPITTVPHLALYLLPQPFLE